MIEEWHTMACGSKWGPWLLVAYVADKCGEVVLGELARRGKIKAGSIPALFALGFFLLFYGLTHFAKRKEGLNKND